MRAGRSRGGWKPSPSDRPRQPDFTVQASPGRQNEGPPHARPAHAAVRVQTIGVAVAARFALIQAA